MSSFDPYYKWLGIPAKDRPVHYYRLLALELFESDADVISSAADQRMAHVRSFQAGPNSALSQKILNEISAARVILLTPQKKAEYDRVLRENLTQGAPPARDAVPVVVAEPADELDFTTATHGKARVQGGSARRSQGISAALIGWIALAGLLAVLGILVVVLKMNAPTEQVASAERPTGPAASQKLAMAGDAKKDSPDSHAPAKANETSVKAPAASPPKPVEPPKAVDPPKPIDPPKPVEQPKPVEEPKTEDPKPEEPSKTDATEPNEPSAPVSPRQPIKPPTANSDWPGLSHASKARTPVPDKAARDEVMLTVKEAFASEYRSKNRLVFATKAQQKADENKGELVARYVLLDEARKAASEGGDGPLALALIDTLAAEYDVAGSLLKAEILDQAVKKARSPNEARLIFISALDASEQAMREEEFVAAKKMEKTALAMARQAKETDAVRFVTQRGKELDVAAREYAAAQKALAKLQEEPEDPAANLAAGKYLCFRKGDWRTGLPMLARGDDDEIKAIVEKDRTDPTSPDDRMALADRWWDAGGKQRAVYWYEKAMPSMTGLKKNKAASRIASAKEDNGRMFLADLTPTDTSPPYFGWSTDRRSPKELALLATVAGKPFMHGLWAEPKMRSQIDFDLSGKEFKQLSGSIALAGYAKELGAPTRPYSSSSSSKYSTSSASAPPSVVFTILGDGKILWQSPPLVNFDEPIVFWTPLAGVTKLQLTTETRSSSYPRWAVWIDPVVGK